MGVLGVGAAALAGSGRPTTVHHAAATRAEAGGWKLGGSDGRLPVPRRVSQPKSVEAMIERVPASGSCVRCQRRLGLASVKVRGRWYGSEACAEGGECPLDAREPAVPEPALYARPRRFFRRRRPKELNAGQ
jgi:hypothetical protein